MCILNMCIEYFSITNAMESRYIDSAHAVRYRGSRALHGPTIIIIHNYDCNKEYILYRWWISGLFRAGFLAYAWLSLDQNLEISLVTLTVFSAYL